MLSTEIRQRFLDYFAGRNHTVVPSSSLVPDKDPSLLFVNAGMVQFKNVFLGIEKRDFTRATSSQKCVRAGGKHNDLENIGRTLRHHTFFEMLGNFSFGDYFKKEAIAFAWEFLLKDLGLDRSKLWVTIFESDDEAFGLWKEVGAPEDRIVRLGEKDNFWSMGDEGPCGPCSEIIYDLGPEVGCRSPECRVGCDCDRYLEIWNLVFMEFDRSKDGTMKRLPRPSIDTGMGLERITSVLQGKIGNYETDLFRPIIAAIEETAGCSYGENEKTDTAIRVIADHARGAMFIINDGVLPSKEGRGYVLRRIIRRALRYGRKIGIEREFFHSLSSIVVDLMGGVFPDVRNNHPFIVRVLKGEEERFMETLAVGMRLYDEVAEETRKKGSRIIPGELVYKLYDTYGFPVDLTREMAEEDSLLIDSEGFEQALEEQKTRSRTSSRIKGEGWAEGHVAALKGDIRTEFVGYEATDAHGALLAIIKDDAMAEALGEGEEAELFFDFTPFYGESGGQIGDEGVVIGPSGLARVLEVEKIKADLFAHRVKMDHGILKAGDAVRLSIDRERRKAVARNHTATHLLHFALRTVLGDHVKQSGSLVEADRLRFDFTHFQALDEAELARVEDIVNEKIMECCEVTVTVKNREDAIRDGAIALFEEKYGETVRVIQICDFSTELCGGTHVRNTGEIGSFAVASEGSLAYGVRRIEALTGKAAILARRKLETMVKSVGRTVNAEPERIPERIEHLAREVDARGREIERLKEAIVTTEVDEAIASAAEAGGARAVSLFVPHATVEQLRRVTDLIRTRAPSCVAAVGTAGEKGTLVVAVGKDVQGRFNAGSIVKRLAERFGGKGGGGPQIAQGGVPADKVREALKSLTTVLSG